MPWRSRSASRSSTELLLGIALGAAGAVALEHRRHEQAEARLVQEAEEREAARAQLASRLITAEQDERRRLSVLLHDGPLQSLSGVALVQDAALAAVREGRPGEAAELLSGALERARAIIQELRDLSFAIEPVVLRDTSLAAAVSQLARRLEQSQQIAVDVDVAGAAGLSEKAQVALYQVLREALYQAAGRTPEHVEVTVGEAENGAFTAIVRDDGLTERRRASTEALEERAHVLGARVKVEADGAGTVVSVAIPQHAALR
jgi:signal transduction histidine kinase